MSLAAYSQPEHRVHRKSLHRRNDSGELDVFEAAQYFSGYNDVISDYNVAMNHHHSQKFSKDSQVPSNNKHYNTTQLLPQQQTRALEKQMTMKDKKHRQPSSPGGKIASFLNSLFNQSATKKKKKSSKSASSTTQSMKNEEESSPAGWRRRRRSSISHFRTSSAVDSSSSKSYYYSSTNSGFRTPPPYVNTPTKSYKEFTSFSDHIHKPQSLSLPRNNIFRPNSNVVNNNINNQVLSGNSSTNRGSINEVKADDRKYYKVETRNNNNNIDKFTRVEREIFIRKSFNQMDFDVDVDDGAESDSSSDLFELPNYDLGYCSSDLPVYETTRIDNIKRGAPISNAAF